MVRGDGERAAEETAEVRTWITDNPESFGSFKNTRLSGFLPCSLTLGHQVASALHPPPGAALKSHGHGPGPRVFPRVPSAPWAIWARSC